MRIGNARRSGSPDANGRGRLVLSGLAAGRLASSSPRLEKKSFEADFVFMDIGIPEVRSSLGKHLAIRVPDPVRPSKYPSDINWS